MLTESDRKLLTEYLGPPEIWHEVVWGEIISWHDTQKKVLLTCACGKIRCGFAHFNSNRTFTAIQDLYALKCKMVERGDWDEFEDDSYIEYLIWKDSFSPRPTTSYCNWLINPDRCETVASWLRGRGR